MRLLLIGDIVGQPGREIVKRALPGLVMERQLDLVIANAENATGGTGLSQRHYEELLSAGVDGITMGDHIYRRKELNPVLESETNIVKPANYPAAAPGRDHMVLVARNGVRVAVISLLGRVFMRPVDCPWTAVDRVLTNLDSSIQVILVDFHAEATSDKQLMGRHLDGKVSAVLGTHTHVATADEQIFPGGTAFQCDIGMTGPHVSILGRRIDRVLETTRTFNPTQFEVAAEDPRLNGTIVEVDPATGKALSIERVSIDQAAAGRLAALAAMQSKPEPSRL